MKIVFRISIHITVSAACAAAESVFFPECGCRRINSCILRYEVPDAGGGLNAMSLGVRGDYAEHAA